MKIDVSESKMWKEIFEQPEVIDITIRKNKNTIEEIAKEVKKRKIKTVVLVGRGSSEHACQVAKYLFETYSEFVATIASPSVITRYEGEMDLSSSLTIGISQSGGAQDVYEVLERSKKQGGLSVSITNVRESLMANTGDYYMNCECGVEESITATKSYMAQLTLLISLVAYISEKDDLITNLSTYSNLAEESLNLENQVREIIPFFRNTDKIMIFGRGLLYSVGLETELKIQETSYLDARCYASSDYYHGPISTTNRFVPSIFFISDESTNETTLTLHDDLKRNYKITSLVVSNKEDIISKGDYAIKLPENMDGIDSLFATIIFSQMFSCLLSVSRGYNPDSPDNVSKNTVTR